MDLEDVPRLRTRRLELVAATPELARAAVDGNAELARLLEVTVPDAWPPATYADYQPLLAAQLEMDARLVGWAGWYVVEAASLTLVGSIGFLGRPDEAGAVEVGYSMIDPFKRRGFATEAMGAVIDWAFSHDEVRSIRGETTRDNRPSIAVMEKNGLSFVGDGSAAGSVRFELRRP